MALKICTFNCKGFNVCKVKHIESLFITCDILLLQETCCLHDQVGTLNRHFKDHNTYGISGINDNELLVGRPYGGVSFLFKKSMSPHVTWVEMSSKRVCCIRLNTDIGYETPRCDHISEVLVSLHWLRIEQRIIQNSYFNI